MARSKPLLGSQTPTHRLVPDAKYSEGKLALEIADMVGVELDPWQKTFLVDSLGRHDTKYGEKWAAFEVGIELSRQNGKSVGFEIRAITGLFVFRERLIVYSAHKGETAMEAFRRVDDLISSDPELKAEVKKVRTGNGKEHILLHSGQMMKFRTRTSGGGRGLSGDCVFLDEAQDLTDDHIAALLPIMSAKSIKGDPQLWYAGSAGGKKSVVLGRLVRRTERREPDLCMYRWAASEDDDPSSVKTWAKTNPAVGIRMSLEHIAKEHRAMSTDKFAQERLGVGDYPREEGEDWVIPRRRWERGTDRKSTMVGKVVFALEVTYNRDAASITVAGRRPDGRKHIECIANEAGTIWTVQDLKQLTKKHSNLGVVLDPASPANALVGPLRDAGIEPILLTAEDLTVGYGSFYDGFNSEIPSIVHTGGTVLTSAMAEAQVRNVRGATTWKRATSADVSSVLGATWAQHMLDKLAGKKPPPKPQSTSGTSPGATTTTADLASAGF